MTNRIDPNQIPRPLNQAQEPIVFDTRQPGVGHIHPPPSTAHFIVRDCGNASPRLMRASLNVLPNNNELLNNGGMAMAVVVSPLALPDPQDDPISVSGGMLVVLIVTGCDYFCVLTCLDVWYYICACLHSCLLDWVVQFMSTLQGVCVC